MEFIPSRGKMREKNNTQRQCCRYVCDDDDASTEKSTYEHGNGLHATGLMLYNTTK